MPDSLIFIVVVGNIAYKIQLMNSNTFRIFDFLVIFRTELQKTDKRKVNYFCCCFTVHFDKFKTSLSTNALFIKT
jgi:hypothetical protein